MRFALMYPKSGKVFSVMLDVRRGLPKIILATIDINDL